MEKQLSNSLSGKRIVILGGSSGIGLATAQRAAMERGDVIIVSSNSKRVSEALATLPASALGLVADLSKEQQVKDTFTSIGKFDHLVYSAGENLTLQTIEDTDIEAAQRFFILRFWGAFAAVKHAAANINAGGSITLTSGTANARPAKGWSVASSICGAIEGFVRAMAVELAPIRVNSVVPGVVKTNLWGSMTAAQQDQLFEAAAASSLLRRVGDADDIALAHLYLMQQRFGSGQNLVIDGGSLLV